MSFTTISAGYDLPNDFNVVVEIPAHGEPVKYEVDKESGVLWVDRFMLSAMYYPANYGYIPRTLSDDGDPVDVLVVTPVPLTSGVVIRCRPVGMLEMTDEAGVDAKILAVPVDKVTPHYRHIQSPDDISQHLLKAITHFFEHYKDLEAGKWVKVNGWLGADAAKKEIMNSAARYKEKNEATV